MDALWSTYTPAAITNIENAVADCGFAAFLGTAFVRISAAGTGSGPGFFGISLPPGITPAGGQFLPAQLIVDGVAAPAWSTIDPNTNTVTVELFSGSFPPGKPVSISVCGHYQTA